MGEWRKPEGWERAEIVTREEFDRTVRFFVEYYTDSKCGEIFLMSVENKKEFERRVKDWMTEKLDVVTERGIILSPQEILRRNKNAAEKD